MLFGILALGEGWHNTHHAFPTSARHRLRWWQIDVSYWVIRVLSWVGLAWNVKLPSKEAQAHERRTGPTESRRSGDQMSRTSRERKSPTPLETTIKTLRASVRPTKAVNTRLACWFM